MNTPAHAPFAPSALERIALCPGSYAACAGVPEYTSPYAEDGTEAHAVLQWCLENGFPHVDRAYAFDKSPIHKWQFRADSREEREQSIQTALDYIFEIIDAHDDAVMYFERRVTFPSMITEDCWGTADIILILPSLGWLYVIDFKHGSGKFVGVTDNLQLGTYASAALASYCEGYKINDVFTVVIQPRAWSQDGEVIRVDTKSAVYYQEFFRDKVDEIIASALDPKAPLVPGKVQCQFCPRRMNCQAREAAALKVASDQFSNIRDIHRINLSEPEHMSLDTLSLVLSGAGMLRDWLRDVEKHAKKLMAQGTIIPGYKLVHARLWREWEGDHNDLADTLSSLTGLPREEMFTRKIISVTEAEKLVVAAFKEGAPRGKKKQAATDAKAVMADLTTRKPSGGYSVAKLEDKRPAVNTATANFGALAITQDDDNEEES